MGKVPLQVLKEFEHQARQNLSTINFTATFAKTASACNTTLKKCQHSLKATFKKVKSQIQKGANPERTARHGYDDACEYLDVMNKRILIQQRALACLSKSVGNILQRELYTMGNTGLLRREAEMTLLQPHLGDSRRQELRNSPFWLDFLLKKAHLNNHRVLDPIKISPFMVHIHHNKKRGSYRKRPYGAIPPKAVTSRFPQVRGKSNNRGFRGSFRPHSRGRGRGNPSPNDSLQASLSPPVGVLLRSFRRDWLANKCSDNVLNIITNGYVLPFISKPKLARTPVI